MTRKEKIRQLAEQHEKSRFDFNSALSKFFIYAIAAWVMAGALLAASLIEKETGYDVIESIDSKRRIVRSINTYNFLSREGDYDFYASSYVTVSEVQETLEKVVARKGKQHLWNKKMYRNAATILVFFNNHDEFQIDWRILLALFSHESQMNPHAVSRLNYDGTRDYGIGQHNSCCIDQRYRHAVAANGILKIVDPRIISADRGNLYAGMIATAIHMKENREVILRHNERNPYAQLGPDHWIIGYNSGISGVLRGMYRKKYLDLVEIDFKGIVEL